jgi:hypothetical protein
VPSQVSPTSRSRLGPLQDGAKLLRVSMYATDPNADMNMEANIPIYVGFGVKGFPARRFRFVFEWVERYILTFEPVFEGKSHPGPPMRRTSSARRFYSE